MCKVKDAAMLMVNHAIDKAAICEDSRYYTDFYKLHKLLYYAQGYMLTKYHHHLFEEEIYAHHCGPIIPALLSLSIGYGPIKNKFPESEICPLTDRAVESIDTTLRLWGARSKDELVHLTKSDSFYRQFTEHDGFRDDNLITKTAMKEAVKSFDGSLAPPQ